MAARDGTSGERDVTGDLGDAATLLRNGSVVGLPTDTVYGVAAQLSSSKGVEELFRLKRRDETKAIAVLVSSIEQAEEIANIGRSGRLLAERFWPGPLTLVVTRRASCTAELGGDASSIGIRQPASDVVSALCDLVGPLATTSANVAGAPTAETAREVSGSFAELTLVIDGGELRSSASTVVDVRGDLGRNTAASGPGDLRILREGPISRAQLDAVLADLA